MTHDWQKLDRSFRKGLKKGELMIFSQQRRLGKSMFAANAMRMHFSSSWTEWEPEWTWTTRVSSRSGRIIWGRIMVRTSKYVVSAGRLIQQRATPKEALTQQKEAFKKALS